MLGKDHGRDFDFDFLIENGTTVCTKLVSLLNVAYYAQFLATYG